MTTWIENPMGGRARGGRALARAWFEVLVRPRRFFRNGVGPGDQAPGLTFAMSVAVAYAAGWMVSSPASVPGIAESVVLSAFVVLLVVGLLAAPTGLHLTAALATVSVVLASAEYRGPTGGRFGIGFRDRAGVSETVQVVAYASAPFALAGPPIPELRLLAGLYATCLLVYGIRLIHDTTWPRAVVAGALPSYVGFGLAYGAVGATADVASRIGHLPAM